MNFNIDYQDAIDFEHIDNINEAGMRFSKLTNLLNQVLRIRQQCKKEILECCAMFPDEHFEKMSWDNKLLRLMAIDNKNCELVGDWQKADVAYRQTKIKQEQLLEDILLLKKQIEIIPR